MTANTIFRTIAAVAILVMSTTAFSATKPVAKVTKGEWNCCERGAELLARKIHEALR